MSNFTYTIGRGAVVHASTHGDVRNADTLCGSEWSNGQRKTLRAVDAPVTCKTCLKRVKTDAVEPSTAPEPYAAPLGPVTAFEAVVAASRAANARVFG